MLCTIKDVEGRDEVTESKFRGTCNQERTGNETFNF